MAGPSLQIPVSAKFDQFKKDMSDLGDSADKAAGDIEDRFKKINPSATAMLESFKQSAEGPAKEAGSVIGLLIAAGVGAAFAGIASKLPGLIDGLAKIGDRADDLRLPVNMLQAMSVAADAARVPQDKLTEALDKFTEVSKKSATGAEDFYKGLGNVGEGFVKAFKDAPTQADRLDVLRKAFNATTSEVKTAQLGLEALGTENIKVIDLFTNGGASMSSYIAQIKKLGLTIDDDIVRQAQEAKSAIALFGRALGDDLSSGIAKVIPYLVQMLPYLEQIGSVVQKTLGAIASVTSSEQNKTSELLAGEVSVLQKEIAKLEDARARVEAPSASDQTRDSLRESIESLRKKDAAVADTLDFLGIGKLTEDAKEQVDGLEKQIARLKVQIALKAKILNDRLDRPANDSSPSTQPAFKSRPKLSSSDDDATTTFDREVDRLKRTNALMEADAAAVGKSADAHKTYRAELQLLQAIEKDSDDVTVEQIARYAQLRASMSATEARQAAGILLTKEQAEAFNEASQRTAAAAAALTKAKTAFEGINDSIRFGGTQLVDVIDQATQKGVNFGNVMAGVLRNVSKQLLEAAILGNGAFAKILGLNSNNGGVGGLGGIVAGLFGTAASGGASSAGGDSVLSGGLPIGQGGIGHNAGGTDNWGGGPTWVGEKGPEIVNLPKGAQVVPNNVAAGGGGDFNFSVVNHVDATGADSAAVARLEAGLVRVNSGVEARALAAMQSHQRRRM